MNKGQIEYAIKNYKEIAKQELYTKSMIESDHKDGFFYDDALDSEGFFIIPDGDEPDEIDFDYGDTSSDGLLLKGANPMDPLPKFQQDLLEALKKLEKSV